MNPGKIFEDDFQKSVPKTCWVKRLNDNTAAWNNTGSTRFSSTNECDFLLKDDITQKMFALELKSSKSSLTFWRSDFKGKQFQIKKNQILGLQAFNQHTIICGFLFNFRNENNDTYFVDIEDFLDYTSKLNKKSINIHDVQKMSPIRIKSIKLRVHYRYDICSFIEEV